MNAVSFRKLSRKLARAHRVERGAKFRLKDHDPGDTGHLEDDDKPLAKDALESSRDALALMQDMLYAQDRWSVLLVFQAMDAAGKDGAIKHVMSGVNPQGCHVVSFKAPSDEELDHDWLWRCVRALPERGRIGIFNRSYYEEVLVVKVRPDILATQKIPKALVGRRIWNERYQDIRALERHLARNGTLILKFFLNVSRAEQKRRFLERIAEPAKNWKFSPADVKERARWDAYMDAYQAMIRETAAPHAPWYVVPADNKWYTRTVVAAAIVDALSRLDLHYPRLGKAQLAELALAKRALAAEKG
ncbi:Polyphosphate:ADP phosphotransferase [Burkholderiales bacterium]|nr:Polyphosphate:ADP phosphotransferase [Burkholderiales bacterium]